MVFPLTTDDPVPEDLPLFAKIRRVCLKNPKMRGLLQGVVGSIPQQERARS